MRARAAWAIRGMLLRRHFHGDCARSASECHPWWQQMFRLLLSMCELPGYAGEPSRGPAVLKSMCAECQRSHLQEHFHIYRARSLCLHRRDVSEFNEVFPSLLLRHISSPVLCSLRHCSMACGTESCASTCHIQSARRAHSIFLNVWRHCWVAVYGGRLGAVKVNNWWLFELKDNRQAKTF